MPERAPEAALSVVVRKGPRTDPQQPRVAMRLVKMLGWILELRRATLTQHDRSPVPGKVTLMAPHYKQGVEKLYADIKAVARLVKPAPLTGFGDLDPTFSKDLNKGTHQCLAAPCDEEGIRIQAVKATRRRSCSQTGIGFSS